jgi:uncharacterized SAM-binding protein YcdF (DUF218 family)
VRSAIVIPGHGAVGPDGIYRISPRCVRLVRQAERTAWLDPPEAVVFSGWSPTGGPSEAEQMREVWRGPEVELVEEPTARFTAENAVRTLQLVLERGVEHAIVVCTPMHLARARFFFGRIYGARGVRTRFVVPPIVPTPGAIAWELFALPACRRQLRTARAELERAT